MATLSFTPARDQDVFRVETDQFSGSQTNIELSGEEARHFYENLMKEDDGSRGDDHREARIRLRRRERRRRDRTTEGTQTAETDGSERSRELLGLRLLHRAHDGDISGLKALLSKGADINFQDSFFWTAIMCASWSGQRAAVRVLLQHGAAWVGVVDTQGRDARDLAQEAGHKEVLEELLSYRNKTKRDKQPKDSSHQPQWCDVCGVEYSSKLSAHLSSTLHQFSQRHPQPTPYYCLPPSSNSYKMMVRCGWKPGKGLGPEGEGSKQPVATVLKRDQEGLGYGQRKRAKVTHFQARDRDAVKAPCKARQENGRKGLRKEEIRRKEQKERNWERDFRASFYL
ncbi:G patch domain and ankyrin repeat-containing protein 1 isoform 1-T2 [Pholidichthys leucotaenia]